ncbi:hypothetical protein FD12_GL001437 [Lentilactobacillus rapi DSM 19907 = JCM 15042]|uniref:Uncharacterized protein n=1 Tax=Lentilactobacillus rapi DSM 19907 = JCM 15042 TaxID=1423795 RepID=A0ABR5P9K8_9LACO|nr:hypothetical protein FD12_GL001437 [Lentilactobacillus rapi DSM 19907 = JCM 15042]
MTFLHIHFRFSLKNKITGEIISQTKAFLKTNLDQKKVKSKLSETMILDFAPIMANK